MVVLTDKSGREFSAADYGFGGAGIGAAKQSESRGYVETMPRQRLVLSGPAGITVRQKMRALHANGYGAICDRVAAWLGPVRPDPDTGDADYNAFIREYLTATCYDSNGYDASGKFALPSYQEMVAGRELIMGDGLSVFTEDSDGAPTVRFFDAMAINSGTLMETDGWLDGVKTDKNDKHIAYRVIPSQADAKFYYSYTPSEIDARDAFFHAFFQHTEDVRGVSPFLAAINPMIDLEEIENSVRELAKIASRIGISIESDATNDSGLPSPIGGVMARRPAFGSTGISSTPAPSEPPMYVENIIGGASVLNLEPGKRVNLHNADREVPSFDEMRGNTLEKIAIMIGLNAQMLFGLFTGRFGGTGPAIRLVMGDAHTWRNRRLERRVPFVKKDYARRIAYAIDKGLIPQPPRSMRNPFRCTARPAEAYTIDVGRDTQADQIRLNIGALSLKQLASERGKDSVTVINERLEEMEYMHNEALKRGLPIGLVFPGSSVPEPAPEEATTTPIPTQK